MPPQHQNKDFLLRLHILLEEPSWEPKTDGGKAGRKREKEKERNFFTLGLMKMEHVLADDRV